MTKFYATRSGITQPSSDEQGAMVHQERGPFATATEARNDLARYFRDGVECKHADISPRIAELFVDQFLGLLTSMAMNPLGTVFTHEADGIRWTIHPVDS